jgi:hypothetical protein
VIDGTGGWDNLDAHVNETIVWVCLAFSILSPDLVLLARSGPPTHTVAPAVNSSPNRDQRLIH